ncbi:MAG: winged helix-turn-helix transcriptional regulator [Deltaproteobacteria bacterium]|nr:winged helix-turn-helix transcriptional regulator [Deltaproteobacteria bacterium]
MYVPPRPLDDVSDLSDLCKALGDATRLQMLQLMAMAKRPLCVCELENQFDLSQPTVSHHLRILRDAGVVSATRRGTWVFYELESKPMQLLRKLQKLLRADSCDEQRAQDRAGDPT